MTHTSGFHGRGKIHSICQHKHAPSGLRKKIVFLCAVFLFGNVKVDKDSLRSPSCVGGVDDGGLHPVPDGAELRGDGLLLQVGHRSPRLDAILDAEHIHTKSLCPLLKCPVLPDQARALQVSKRSEVNSLGCESELSLRCAGIELARQRLRGACRSLGAGTAPLRPGRLRLRTLLELLRRRAGCGSCRRRRESGPAITAADKCSSSVCRGLAKCFTSLLSLIRSGDWTDGCPQHLF